MQVRAVRTAIGYGTYKSVLSSIDWIAASAALAIDRMMLRAKLLIEMHNRLSLSDERRPTKPPAGGGPSSRLYTKTWSFS